MPRNLTPQERLALEVALDAVKMHQTALWDAIGDLEALLGESDLVDSTTDFEAYDVDALLELAESNDDDEPGHDDTVHFCPECERPNQFGELCVSCEREERDAANAQTQEEEL